MNAFDQYEVWFVTGAQLLYGGDAVIAVDAHSNEMVAGLNASGKLPVKVVYKSTTYIRPNKNISLKVINICISRPKCLLDFQNKPIFADNFYSKNKTTYMSRLKKLKKIRIHREGTHTLAGSLLLLLVVNSALYFGLECKLQIGRAHV